MNAMRPRRINSRLHVDAITDALTPANARALLESYDVILDCTDNPATRYLLSDTAVLLGKPLVSGAAQRFDGQLCTYNLGPEGPCYRCLFPRPPTSSEAMPSCEETGILGAVTGVIGSLQALEAIKVVVGLHGKFSFSFPHPSQWVKEVWVLLGGAYVSCSLFGVTSRRTTVLVGLCRVRRTAFPQHQTAEAPRYLPCVWDRGRKGGQD